eukprot:TRINITY_DN25496_c0_g1_i1.p1 TRINITY_DN25496_c0_g1~~TRINITY_DN25496_c0_g1_i1.p1  ORF type:complete len:189 (-),score=5.73 TRINITY_DN25496_c0_g1_i1:298-864(-)
MTSSCSRRRSSRSTRLHPSLNSNHDDADTVWTSTQSGPYADTQTLSLCRLYKQEAVIKPRWDRITASPWRQASRVTGGYGCRMINGMISTDGPDFMLSCSRFSYQADPQKRCVTAAPRKRAPAWHYAGEACTAVSADTPSFFQLRHGQVYGTSTAATQGPQRHVLPEPVVTPCSLVVRPATSFAAHRV